MKLFINRSFGMVPVELLNNPEISLRAKGIYGMLQSKPDGWAFSVDRLAAQCKESKDTVRKAIKELEEAGYLQRVQERNEKGKWTGINYILSDKPFASTSVESGNDNPVSGNPVSGKPVYGNTDDGESVDGNGNDISNKDIVKKKIIKKKKNIIKKEKSDFFNFNPLVKEPSPSDIKEYASFIGYPMTDNDAELFLNHYRSTGWRKTGDIKILDWRPLINVWKLNNQSNLKKSVPEKKNAKDYWDTVLEKAGISA